MDRMPIPHNESSAHHPLSKTAENSDLIDASISEGLFVGGAGTLYEALIDTELYTGGVMYRNICPIRLPGS